MKYEVLGKNGYKPTKEVIKYADKRLSKVIKLLGEKNISTLTVLCKKYKDHEKVEITIRKGKELIRAERKANDLFAAIDISTDALIRQINRHRDKLVDKNKMSIAESEQYMEKANENALRQVAKVKEIELYPLSVTGAIASLELSDHDFYIYQDEKTGNVNVIYRRNDGDYAIIKTK